MIFYNKWKGTVENNSVPSGFTLYKFLGMRAEGSFVMYTEFSYQMHYKQHKFYVARKLCNRKAVLWILHWGLYS